MISFGTFSGLIIFSELYFYCESIDKGSYKNLYSIYLAILCVLAIYNANLYREIAGSKAENNIAGDKSRDRQQARNKVLNYFFTGGISNCIDSSTRRVTTRCSGFSLDFTIFIVTGESHVWLLQVAKHVKKILNRNKIVFIY